MVIDGYVFYIFGDDEGVEFGVCVFVVCVSEDCEEVGDIVVGDLNF